MVSLGEKIKQFRLDKRLTEIEFANRLDISPITIIRYEKGDRKPKTDFFDKIAKEFPSTNVSYFFSDQPPGVKEETKTEIEKINIINNDEIDLKALWKVLWNSKRKITMFVIPFLLLGIVYAFVSTPLFYSNISIVPAAQPSSAVSMGSLTDMATSVGLEMGSQNEGMNILDFIQSRRLMDLIIDKKWVTGTDRDSIDLITCWGINDTTTILYKTIKLIKSLASPIITFDEEDPVPIWREKARVELEERIVPTQSETGLILVEVWMEDPILAFDIAKYVGDAVIRFNNEINSDYWRQNREFIEKRIEEVKKELEKAEQELIDFQTENRRISDSPELQMILIRLTRGVEIQTELYTTLQNEYELARIEEVKDTPSILILDEAYYPAEKDKPKRIKIILMSVVVGFILSPPIFLIIRGVKSNRSPRRKRKKKFLWIFPIKINK